MATPGLVGEVFGGWVRDLSAKTKQKTKKTTKKGAFDDDRQAKDDLNFDWRAICDRRLSCPTLLSPIILFHFRKTVEVPKKCSSTTTTHASRVYH